MQSNNLISIIICTYNRSGSLKKVLDTLLAQQGVEAVQYEVIIVDNNSKDDTAEVVRSYEEKFGGRLRYIFEPRQGVNMARNRGLQVAKGEVIAFTDDDVVLAQDWLSQINSFCKNYEFDAAGGRVLPNYPPQTPRWVRQHQDLLSGPIVSHDYGEEIKFYSPNMLPFLGANMIIKKKIFDEVGVFHPELGVGRGTMGDDTEFFRRMQEANKKIYYNGQIFLWHPVTRQRMNLRYISRWNINSGRGSVRRGPAPACVARCCGIPRYLLRKFFESFFMVLTSHWCRKDFLCAWQETFRYYGMMAEYRRQFRCRKLAQSSRPIILKNI